MGWHGDLVAHVKEHVPLVVASLSFIVINNQNVVTPCLAFKDAHPGGPYLLRVVTISAYS